MKIGFVLSFFASTFLYTTTIFSIVSTMMWEPYAFTVNHTVVESFIKSV